jgi:outer membrane protein OmpA-like peptidoglycan-associated protein
MILALLAVAATTTAGEARDPSVRVDRSVIESLGPPPAPRGLGGAPRAGGLPLAPDTVPQATPPRRPVQRPRPAPAQRAARPPAPAGPLPLPPEEPAAVPPIAAPAPLPLPPTPPPPPPVVAAPAPDAPPSAATPAPAPPEVAAAPQPAPPAVVAAPRPAAAPAAARPAAPPPERVQLLFTPEAQELTKAMRDDLRRLAGSLPEDETLRLTVNAYAGGDPAHPSLARRASLARALAVRTALMEAGVRSTRIDVRALGLNAGDGPPDRVDVLVGSSR